MPTFTVPCLYCEKDFTWQNDSNPDRDPRTCCHQCEIKFAGVGKEKQCVICGDIFTEHHTGAMRIMLNTCFECNFWIEYITRPHPNRVIINNEHFVADPVTTGNPRFKGFGGRMFEIERLDGTTFLTNNLWHQGDIPKRFQKYFPANATYLGSLRKKEQV